MSKKPKAPETPRGRMRAKLKSIQSNDHPHSSWDAFTAAFGGEGSRHSGWFSIEVGADDETPGGDWFQVLVCTHEEAAKLGKQRGRSRYVIAEVFSPDGILSALREHVSRARGDSWPEIQDALRKSMWWERETIRA